ncbi:MAG: hypothetical protein ACI9XZ_000324, partial [Alphaproteobacteria bacterium]
MASRVDVIAAWRKPSKQERDVGKLIRKGILAK